LTDGSLIDRALRQVNRFIRQPEASEKRTRPSFVSVARQPTNQLLWVGFPVARGFALKLIEPVERGHFVRFRERRIVEYRVAKIVDGAAVTEHRLADVNDLGSPLPERMNAQ